MNLYRALSEAAPLLDRFGGHAAAAGFTVRREQVAELAEALGGACAKLAAGSGPVATHREVDAEVRLADVDERLAQELAGLGPFGQDNPSPVLITRNVRVTALRRVGDGSHLKLSLEDDRQITRSAIGFGLGARELAVGARLDVAFLPCVTTWQGRRSAELELVDLVDLAAPPFGGADGRERVPSVATAAPPFGGADGRERVPSVATAAPPFGGADGRERVPSVATAAAAFGGADGRDRVSAVDLGAAGAAGGSSAAALSHPS